MRAPTDAMIDLAERIADRLGIDPPDMDDFDDVADFIYLNKEEFYRTESCKQKSSPNLGESE